MAKGRLGCKIAAGVVVAGVLLSLPWIVQVAKVVADAQKAGLLNDEKTDKYQASRENNLKAIQKALSQAADSDGAFPQASQWMDTALVRLKTSDLSESEARDKLRVPGTTEGFGYAFNDALSGKSPDEFRDKPKTVVAYESLQSTWNAHGDPKSDGRHGGKAVALDGSVVRLN